MADNITIKDGGGASVVVISKDTGGSVQLPGHHIADPTTPSQKLAIDSGGRPTVNVNGTVPVSAASLPLPTGAATEATLGTTNTEIGGLTETAPATDTASSGLNGRLQRIAQRLTSLIALLPGSIGQKAKAASLAVTLASDQDALPVTGTFFQATQPVSAASLPLPIGAATAANQATEIADLAAIAASVSGTLVVDGSGVTQPVSAAALPLPTGAATSAAQGTGNTSLGSIDTKTPALGQALAAASVPVVLPTAQITTLTPPAAITGFALDATVGTTNTEIGGLTETAPATDTASSGLNGRLQRVAQRITSLIAATLATSVADGSNVVEGAVADASVAAGATGSISAKLRRISNDIGTLVTGTVIAAGTALIGAVAAALRTDSIMNGTTSLTPKFAFATLSATGSVVALVAAKKIRVLRYSLMADAACTAYFRTIATTTQISGVKYCSANGGAGGTFSPVGHFETLSGEALGLFIVGTANVSVDLTYVEV